MANMQNSSNIIQASVYSGQSSTSCCSLLYSCKQFAASNSITYISCIWNSKQFSFFSVLGHRWFNKNEIQLRKKYAILTLEILMIVKSMLDQYLVINILHHLKLDNQFKCLLLEIRTYLCSSQLGLSSFSIEKREILRIILK